MLEPNAPLLSDPVPTHEPADEGPSSPAPQIMIPVRVGIKQTGENHAKKKGCRSAVMGVYIYIHVYV